MVLFEKYRTLAPSGDYNSTEMIGQKPYKVMLSLYLIGHPIHLIRELMLKWSDIDLMSDCYNLLCLHHACKGNSDKMVKNFSS